MSEVTIVTPEMPFEHPDVQAMLGDNTELVHNTHLFVGVIGYKCGNINACIAAEVQDGHTRTELIKSMWSALNTQAPFAIQKSLNEYDSWEESLSIVKVNEQGNIIEGSEAQVAILDPRSRAILKCEPTFTRDDISLVLGMLQKQEALPWEPKYLDNPNSPVAETSLTLITPPLELLPPAH